MTITCDVKPYWDAYSCAYDTLAAPDNVIEGYQFSPSAARAVDAAMEAAMVSLKVNGVHCASDDRAESLMGAIARYVVQSARG